MEVRHLMNDKWNNKRERRSFDIFEELKEMEQIMNEILQRACKNNGWISPRVHIFSIKTGPRSRVKSTGRVNVDGRRYDNRGGEQREALVDVFDKKDDVVVVAEVQNVKREDIELHKSGCFLTISVNRHQQRYCRTMELPAEVNVDEAEINCKNGVLEVILPKLEKGIK
jgi:HSP20 family molecular chaperone IbpA